MHAISITAASSMTIFIGLIGIELKYRITGKTSWEYGDSRYFEND